MTGDAAGDRSITDRQDDTVHLRRLLAYSHEYRVARRWRALRMAGTLVLAAVSPLVVIFWPKGSELLAAVAAGWLVLGRTGLTRFEDQRIDRATRVHELYDTRLFRLPWNKALVGREPAPDDIATAASRIKDDTRYRGWYTVDVDGLPEPEAVVLCQRQSAVWARRDHIAYSRFLMGLAGIWFVVGVALAIGRDMTLTDYLVKLFLPSAPAYLDAVELARSHAQHSDSRQQLENDLDDLWERRSSHVLTLEDCRPTQDAAFILRRRSPRVPNWFYRFRRSQMTRATTAGAKEFRRADPD